MFLNDTRGKTQPQMIVTNTRGDIMEEPPVRVWNLVDMSENEADSQYYWVTPTWSTRLINQPGFINPGLK